MAGTLTTFSTVVKESDLDSIWLMFDNPFDTYERNVTECKYGAKVHEKFMEHCQVRPNIPLLRLGETAQVLIKSVLKTVQAGHLRGRYFGQNISPDSIRFYGGNIWKAKIKPLHHQATEEERQQDYLQINLLIDFMLDTFNASVEADFLPAEVAHFRFHLENSEGNELHIKNHFALWGYKERKQFVHKMDNMSQQPALKSVLTHQCEEVEFNVFNPILENGNGVERDKFFFKYHFYVPHDYGLLHDKLTEQKSFIALFHFMRNVYHHGRFYKDQHYSSQAIEYQLHSSFPFAIEQLCIQFSESGLITRFWDLVQQN